MNARTNKGVYIKLAQHLAQLDYLIPGFVFRVQGFRVGLGQSLGSRPSLDPSFVAPVPFLVLLLSLFLAPVRYFSCARTHARPAWCGPRDAHVTHPAYIAVPRASRSGRRQGVRDTGRRGAGGPSRGGAADRRTAWPWPRADAWRTAAPRRSEALSEPHAHPRRRRRGPATVERICNRLN